MKVEEIFKELHQCPEVGFELHKTSEIVRRELEKLGIPYSAFALTGIVGKIDAGKPTTILLRADMDALPIKEKTGLLYASTNGNMHACGHDAHTAMLLGAASELMKQREKLDYNILLVFQPFEEGMQGAKKMVEEGATQGENIIATFALHVAHEREVGVVELKQGVVTPMGANFQIEVKGQGGHAGYVLAHQSPVYLAAKIINKIESLSDPKLNRMHVTHVDFGQFDYPGVVASRCFIEGAMRLFTQEETLTQLSQIEKIIKQEIKGYDLETRFTYQLKDTPNVINCSGIEKIIQQISTKLGLSIDVIASKTEFMRDDFSWFSAKNREPSYMLYLGCAPKGKKDNAGHTSGFVVDLSMLQVGVNIFINFVNML